MRSTAIIDRLDDLDTIASKTTKMLIELLAFIFIDDEVRKIHITALT